MTSLIEQFVAATQEAPFPEDKFPQLAEEVRNRIVDTVARNGGHLASNLGVVELTIALLTIFRPEKDRIVWDVSHQGYAWKLLTGRADQFGTIRRHGGISGFLKRHESPCDAFDAGHAGTAISAALGLAAARDLNGRDEHVVAVVGDASFSNGISLEALNNVAATTNRFIVVLNDNEMSISQNVGALSRYFGRLLSSNRYNRVKKAIESAAKKLRLDPLRGTYYKVEHALKGLFVRNGFVESFGLRYVGPIDGHDFKSLLSALAIARDSDRPILIHIGTTKGKGYAPAESEPDKWHGVGPFDRNAGKPQPSSPGFSAAFGEALTRLADDDKRVVAITAAMKSGTGLDSFAAAHPDRFFDVGICEEHAATFAGGLAASGMHPFVALYSTFAQRAVDSVFHDICLQNLPVTFCLDRAGVVGADGPTHHGLYDLPLFRSFPNIVLLQPRDEAMLGTMLRAALALPSPCAIRYPRGKGVAIASGSPRDEAPFEIGKAEIVRKPVRDAADVWIWALGDMLTSAIEAADILEKDGFAIGVVDPRSIKPLDTALLMEQARSGTRIVTIEDGTVIGGFGSAVLEALAAANLPGALVLGFPDSIIAQGTQSELLADHGLDGPAIAQHIRTLALANQPTNQLTNSSLVTHHSNFAMNPILSLALTTFIPGLELRASIPLGFFHSDIRAALGIPGVVLVCLAVNIVVGILVFALMKPVELILRKWGWFDRHVWPLLESKREKLRPLVVKYGVWGVAIFIGVPLPGTGAYSGAVGAYLLALDRKRFWLANILGVAIACVAVTAICLLIDKGADLGFVRRLFLKEA